MSSWLSAKEANWRMTLKTMLPSKKEFAAQAPRYLSGIVNKFWLQQAHNVTEQSVGVMEFGLHGHTRKVHGIILAVKAADDGVARHANVKAACQAEEDELGMALRQAFQKFESDHKVWSSISAVLDACHNHVYPLDMRPQDNNMRGKMLVQVELEVRLADLDATSWCLPMPYWRIPKKKGANRKGLKSHAMRAGAETDEIAPVDYQQICQFLKGKPNRWNAYFGLLSPRAFCRYFMLIFMVELDLHLLNLPHWP